MRLRVRSLPLLSGLTILRCRELWCRLQTRLGSHVAVALATAPIRPLVRELPSAMAAALKRMKESGVPVVAQWLTNPTRNHEVAGSIPALAQWVRRCRELWCRSQTRLGSRVAVALV